MKLTFKELPVISDLSELYRYRQLLAALVVRQLKERYRGSFLGFFWTLMNPLLLMVVYNLVFSVYMRTPMPEGKSYAVFLMCGLLPWIWLAQSLTEGTNSILAGGNLVTKSMFPARLLPTVTVTSSLVNFMVSLPVLIVFLLFKKVDIHLEYYPFVLLAFVVQFMFIEGLVLMASALNVFYRDIQHLVGNLMTLWFFLTPVLYPIENVPVAYRWMVYLNPVTPIIRVYQQVWFDNQMPDFNHLGLVALLSLGLWITGSLIFDRHRDRFAEII